MPSTRSTGICRAGSLAENPVSDRCYAADCHSGGHRSGILSALRPGSIFERVATLISLAGVSIADFWLGLMLIFLFAVELDWLPTSGYGGASYVVLPAIALAARPMGRLTQVIRDSLS